MWLEIPQGVMVLVDGSAVEQFVYVAAPEVALRPHCGTERQLADASRQRA
ncbi:MAG: hypothetical protein LBE08_01395 [Bifidobacteriaceae bacterium]|nr:hypothetical protein [Bifidobacteriaceae bacterium]